MSRSIAQTCQNCQEEFLADPREVNRGNAKFCSRTCSGLFKSSLPRIIHPANTQCSWCGIDFYRKPTAAASKSGSYYCSIQHQNKGSSAGLHTSGPQRTEWQYENCLFCKQKLKSNTRTGLHKECKEKFQINLWIGGDNAATLDRSLATREPVGTKGFVKKYLLETRGDACEECSFDKHGPFGSIIQMDHINGNCFDNRLENLKLLCPNCHSMTPTYGSRNKGSGRGYRRK